MAEIRLENISHTFHGGVQAVKNVNVTLSDGSNNALLGPSGCGKTTLMKIISGLLKPTQGRVFFDDYEISSMSERRLVDVRKRIGFLFQGGALFDSMSVEKNICFPLVQHGTATPKAHRDRCRAAGRRYCPFDRPRRCNPRPRTSRRTDRGLRGRGRSAPAGGCHPCRWRRSWRSP